MITLHIIPPGTLLSTGPRQPSTSREWPTLRAGSTSKWNIRSIYWWSQLLIIISPRCQCLEGSFSGRHDRWVRESQAGRVGLPRDGQVHQDLGRNAGGLTSRQLRRGAGESETLAFTECWVCLDRWDDQHCLSLAWQSLLPADATDVRYQDLITCDLQMVGDEFSRKPYALAVQQGSPLKDQLNDAYEENLSFLL